MNAIDSYRGTGFHVGMLLLAAWLLFLDGNGRFTGRM